MTKKDESKLLELLVKYKWDKDSGCSKCGRKVFFEKSRYEFGRRCKMCGYDESVIANTVFHGLHFPLKTAYDIVVHILENEERDEKKELRFDTRYGYYYFLTRKGISELYHRGEISHYRMDKFMMEWYRFTKITVKKIHKQFRIEENTAQLFIDKIFNRLPEDYDVYDDKITNVVQYFEMLNHNLDFVLGLMMCQMPPSQGWKHCKATIDGKSYVFIPPERNNLVWTKVEGKSEDYCYW